MTISARHMSGAVRRLEAALDSPVGSGVSVGNWRWTVRQRMGGVRDALMGESPDAADGWLAARGGTAFRERNSLLLRLNDLGPRVLEESDIESVRGDIKRLLADIGRHVQRLTDLVYDEVEMEIGGSE